MDDNRPIRLWKWDKAPEEYRALVAEVDDLDKLAHIPKEYVLSDDLPYNIFPWWLSMLWEAEGSPVVVRMEDGDYLVAWGYA